jgi:hypothetical protein
VMRELGLPSKLKADDELLTRLHKRGARADAGMDRRPP